MPVTVTVLLLMTALLGTGPNDPGLYIGTFDTKAHCEHFRVVQQARRPNAKMECRTDNVKTMN